MPSLRPYLPSHLVRSLTKPAPPDRIDRFTAALHYCDLSGFTAMTERLQKRGRRGAEEIARFVNAEFRPVIRAMRRGGGSIVTFEGDAVFALYRGRGSVRRAMEAAGSIVETANAPLSQVIHHGAVRGIHLGDADRRHYLLDGAAVSTLGRWSKRAARGQVLLTPAARRLRNQQAGAARLAPLPRVPKQALASYLPVGLRASLGNLEGSFRQAAVMFVERKGHAVSGLPRFHRLLLDVLDEYEGLLLKTCVSGVGSSWMCLFGIPRGHEDDPRRAARAALDLIGGPDTLRVGLDAGVLAHLEIGDRSRRGIDVVGDVVNTAARLVTRANWGEAAVPARLTPSLSGIRTRPRGRLALKGKEAPLMLRSLVGRAAVRAGPRGRIPLTGRTSELDTVTRSLERARQGRGSALTIRGGPGIGKSRLAWEGIRIAHRLSVSVHRAHSLSFGERPYGPCIRLAREILGLEENATRASIASSLRTVGGDAPFPPLLRRHFEFLLGLSSKPPSQDPRLLWMNCQRVFERLLLESDRPRLLVLEDLHWADELSRQVVDRLVDRLADRPVLLLLTTRGDHSPSNRVLDLVELDRRHTHALVQALAPRLSPDRQAAVTDRAEGNPLYVEELVRHLTQSPHPGADGLPSTLESIIQSRLDGLDRPARRLAQAASILGRRCALADLQALLGPEEAAVIPPLEKARILFAEGADVVFKHALVRDATYQSILGRQRTIWHRAAAQQLSGRQVDPTLLARHWMEAGEQERARPLLLAASREATEAKALKDARGLLGEYFRLVEKVTPESVEARITLGYKVLGTLRDYDAAEAELRTARREAAEILAHDLEAQALESLGSMSVYRGRWDQAKTLLQEALTAFRKLGNHLGEARCRGILGAVFRHAGEVEAAMDQYRRALRLSGRARGSQLVRARILANLANLLAQLGRIPEAIANHRRALRLSRRIRDRSLEGIVLDNLAYAYSLRGDRDREIELSRQAIAIHRELGDRQFEAYALANLASALPPREGLRALKQALEVHRELGNQDEAATVLGWLGKLQYEQGHLSAASRSLNRSVALLRLTDNRRELATSLVSLSMLKLLRGESAASSLSLLDEAEKILKQIRAPNDLAGALEARCRVLLSHGAPTGSTLTRLRRLARQVDVEGVAEIAQKVERVLDGIRRGESMLRGYLDSELSPGLRRALTSNRTASSQRLPKMGDGDRGTHASSRRRRPR